MIVARWRTTHHERRELEIRDTLAGESTILWYEFGSAPPDLVRGALDSAAIAMLPWAMSRGQDLHLEGSVDRSLLANLDDYQEAWSLWRNDRFRRVVVTADEERSDVRRPEGTGAVVAFSGGVDACYTVAANATGALGRRSIEPALAVMVHGFDIPVHHVDGIAEARRRAEAILSEFGVPLLTVRTNWKDDFSVDWVMTFMAGIASVLHQCASTHRAALVASEESYDLEVIPWGSNSVTNHLLGSDAFPVRTVGLGSGRTERCGFINQWDVIRENVRVCWAGPEPGRNCGSCEKCIRTKLNFLAAGAGAIPALGEIDEAAVRSLRCANLTQLSYLRDVAGCSEQLPAHLAEALAEVVARESAVLGGREDRA